MTEIELNSQAQGTFSAKIVVRTQTGVTVFEVVDYDFLRIETNPENPDLFAFVVEKPKSHTNHQFTQANIRNFSLKDLEPDVEDPTTGKQVTTAG